MGITREALKDGSILRGLIEQFNNEKNDQHFLQAISCLRDCIIYIPVDMQLSKNMQEKIALSKKGERVKLDKNITLIADIVVNGDKKFLPVFSSPDQMTGEYGEKFTKIERPFLNAMSMAIANNELEGIVVDPFTNAFPIKKDVFGIIARMQTNIEGENKSQIYFEQCDITRIKCDCIVNAANESLLGGGGVDGAIHRAAGPELLEECKTLGGCETGEAKITKGYNLPAKYVIHTVGPVYTGKPKDKELLASCYVNSLNLAKENDIHSIAFPAISTGVYGYPINKAAEVSLTAIARWMNDNKDYNMSVIMSCFDKKTYQTYMDYVRSTNPQNK